MFIALQNTQFFIFLEYFKKIVFSPVWTSLESFF